MGGRFLFVEVVDKVLVVRGVCVLTSPSSRSGRNTLGDRELAKREWSEVAGACGTDGERCVSRPVAKVSNSPIRNPWSCVGRGSHLKAWSTIGT